ncbi:MAG: hypothetical protein AAF081_00295 [Actinomycetota bacterium]
MSLAHDPAAEAAELVGPDITVRVLEPSPPTVHDGPFFADDPATAGTSDQPVVTPTSGGDLTWDDLLAERPELADFAAERWLGNRGRLPAVPANYPVARDAFHRLAYGVVAEARKRANTKFGLRYTRGGFGTPFFGDDEQVRVEGTRLIHQRAGDADAIEITTLRAAADFLGVEPCADAAEHDSPELGDHDEVLAVTEETGVFLGAWFGLAWAVIEELRLTPGAHDVERTQLWPGHFDPAIAMGDAEVGGRATYGMSPGDHGHDEPYLYVGAWGEVDRDDPYWNETSFNGAAMSFADLAAADDPFVAALTFFRTGYVSLNPD